MEPLKNVLSQVTETDQSIGSSRNDAPAKMHQPGIGEMPDHLENCESENLSCLSQNIFAAPSGGGQSPEIATQVQFLGEGFLALQNHLQKTEGNAVPQFFDVMDQLLKEKQDENKEARQISKDTTLAFVAEKMSNAADKLQELQSSRDNAEQKFFTDLLLGIVQAGASVSGAIGVSVAEASVSGASVAEARGFGHGAPGGDQKARESYLPLSDVGRQVDDFFARTTQLCGSLISDSGEFASLKKEAAANEIDVAQTEIQKQEEEKQAEEAQDLLKSTLDTVRQLLELWFQSQQSAINVLR